MNLSGWEDFSEFLLTFEFVLHTNHCAVSEEMEYSARDIWATSMVLFCPFLTLTTTDHVLVVLEKKC